uniref:STAS domain-containing protein n=1 Tax=Periophthalmus magnuspinnatus TaxID=409849 RepID=A0A3B3ZR66_9GOBI
REERGHPMDSYVVQREVLNEVRLEEVAQRDTSTTGPSVGERLKEFSRCSLPKLKKTVQRWVPVLDWLPKYPFRENILGDVASGCSVAIMHLPQGMAYALLASLPPVFGLYTSLYPVLVYFIFGTSRHISIGTFAVISIMVGSVTERLGPDSNFQVNNGTNTTGSVDIDARDAYRVKIACSLTLLVGIFQILLGMVKFGFVVNYLSEPLVRGYTTGSACHVFVSQLKYIFGVTSSRYNGPLSLIYTVVDICRRLPQTKIPELVVSLVALAVLIVVKEINGCYSKKLPFPIPIELIVIVATIITHFGGLTTLYDIDVVGEIPSGLNAPQAPDVNLFSQIIGDAFAVAIVGYAINISLGKTFALKHGYKVDSNQELVALGLSNSIGACFQCYSVTSSLSRSLVQESTGGKTQVAGVISSIFVLIIVLKIGSLFEDLPKAVLSTIVFVNLKGMFKQFTDVPQLWRTNQVDLLVWLITFVMPGTDLYLETETYKQAKEICGIKIFRSSSTIYYTNAEMYLDALQEKCGIEIGKLLTAKKKEEARVKRQQEKQKKKEKKLANKQSTGSFTLTESQRKEPTILNENGNGNDYPSHMTETKGQINWAYQHDAATLETDSDTDNSQIEDEAKGNANQKTHSIILDMSTTNFVDTVTIKTLKNVTSDINRAFVTVHDAVLHIQNIQMYCTTKIIVICTFQKLTLNVYKYIHINSFIMYYYY